MKKILFFISWDEIVIWHLLSYRINLKEKQPQPNQKPTQNHGRNILTIYAKANKRTSVSPLILLGQTEPDY